jgi:hypothetical protein
LFTSSRSGIAPTLLTPVLDRDDRRAVVLDALNRGLQDDCAAEPLDVGVERLPHHPGAEARVLELFDERLNLCLG